MKNAVDVLRAILCPENEAAVTDIAFARFFAMFGPINTAMVKIEALLWVAHDGGEWLYFDRERAPEERFAAFDPAEANCLVVTRVRGGLLESVWNLPDVEGSQQYLVDNCGKTYSNWREYFVRNPMVKVEVAEGKQEESGNENDSKLVLKCKDHY